MSDLINQPSHYTSKSMECIEMIDIMVEALPPQDAVRMANIIKYLYRYTGKNGVQDLQKAQKYLSMLIERYEGNPETQAEEKPEEVKKPSSLNVDVIKEVLEEVVPKKVTVIQDPYTDDQKITMMRCQEKYKLSKGQCQEIMTWDKDMSNAQIDYRRKRSGWEQPTAKVRKAYEELMEVR